MRSSAFGAFCFSLIQVVLALALGEHLTVTGELALITVFGNSWRFASFNGLGGIFWNFFLPFTSPYLEISFASASFLWHVQ